MSITVTKGDINLNFIQPTNPVPWLLVYHVCTTNQSSALPLVYHVCTTNHKVGLSVCL